MARSRLAAAGTLAALVSVVVGARPAGAVAEVHRLNLVLSAIPTEIKGGDVNDEIDYNNQVLQSAGLKGLDPIQYGWMFEAQLRYLIHPRLALNAGVGQLRKATEQEYLPAIQQAVQLRYEVFSVPVSVGGAYYFAPYNQGDFQARAYMGGGFLSLVQNRLKYQQTAINVPGVTSYATAAKRDAPGYYVEGGVHMFFASRVSVLLGAVFRSAKIEALLDRDTHEPRLSSQDALPLSMDMSGVGGRMAIAFGF